MINYNRDEQKDSFSMQIERDSAFLTSINVVEYKLRCGVGKCSDFGPMDKNYYLRYLQIIKIIKNRVSIFNFIYL